MPFTPEFDSLYTELIKPALDDAGYVCSRADSVIDQRNVMSDVILGIGKANLVVAELTGLNPNVLYEVGLAHGLRIPTVLLAQSIDEVPFDLRGYRIQEYSTRFDEVQELRESLAAIAREHAAGRVNFGSPVIDFLDSIHSVSPPNDGARGNSADVDEQSGFLDWLADWEESTERLGEIGVRIGEATTDMGEDLSRHGEQLTKLQDSPSPGTAGQARRIAGMAASDLTRYAGRLEQELPDFETTVNAMVEGGLGYLSWVAVEDDEDRQSLRDADGAIQGMLDATRGALEGVQEMRGALTGITGATVELDRAVRRAAKALDRVIGLLEKTESFCHRASALLAEKADSETA
jgi:hypothetical protein